MVYKYDAHFKLDVQFCHRAGEHAEVRKNMFTEVCHKSSGMHVFLLGQNGKQALKKNFSNLINLYCMSECIAF